MEHCKKNGTAWMSLGDEMEATRDDDGCALVQIKGGKVKFAFGYLVCVNLVIDGRG